MGCGNRGKTHARAYAIDRFLGLEIMCLAGGLLFVLGFLFYPEYILYEIGVSGQPLLFLLPLALLTIGFGLVYGSITKDQRAN